MTLNSGAAERLEGCTESQFAADDNTPSACPAGSRIGEITAISPALTKPATGFVYFAKPTGGHPWRQFLEVSGSGVRTKLISDLTLDPQTGRIKSVIDNIPQQPVSSFQVRYYGGERAGLQNPPTCGTHSVTAKLTPWTAAPAFAPADDVVVQGTFTTSADGAGAPCESPQPFRPTLATSSNPSQAGAYTNSRIQIGRPDGHQLIKNLSLSLPAGLIGIAQRVAPLPGERRQRRNLRRAEQDRLAQRQGRRLGHPAPVSGIDLPRQTGPRRRHRQPLDRHAGQGRPDRPGHRHGRQPGRSAKQRPGHRRYLGRPAEDSRWRAAANRRHRRQHRSRRLHEEPQRLRRTPADGRLQLLRRRNRLCRHQPRTDRLLERNRSRPTCA